MPGSDQIATYGELNHRAPSWWAMDAHELRAKALHYRRIAALVRGEVAEALLELAADYASLADKLEESEPTPGAAKQSSQQCPSKE